MSERKFEVGHKVNILVGKYAGCNAHVTDYHPAFKYHTYSVEEIQTGTALLLYEHELQARYVGHMPELFLRSLPNAGYVERSLRFS